jgi:hypothetical protein
MTANKGKQSLMDTVSLRVPTKIIQDYSAFTVNRARFSPPAAYSTRCVYCSIFLLEYTSLKHKLSLHNSGKDLYFII